MVAHARILLRALINASFIIASEARQSSALIKRAFLDRRVATLLAMTIDRSALKTRRSGDAYPDFQSVAQTHQL